MSNILVVESKNDRIFINTFIGFLNLEQNLLISVDDYRELEGSDATKLRTSLEVLKDEAPQIGLEKIGIILDIDNEAESKKLNFINECINHVFQNASRLVTTKEFITVTTDYDDILQVACYFTQVDSAGELETVLKTIKAKNSPHADCLKDWKNCIEQKDCKVTLKEFDKFWLSIYLRYDTCTKEEQKQASKKCSMSGFDYVMKNKQEIWDFHHPVLNDLKQFLQLFVSADESETQH